MDKVPNAWIMELCGVKKGVAKRLMKMFYDDPAMWREWKMTGLLRGLCRGVCW